MKPGPEHSKIETLGELLRRLRESAGMTLAQAGERSGVSVGYISALENNKRQTPSGQVLMKLARAYPGADYDELLMAAAEESRVITSYVPATRRRRSPDKSADPLEFRLDWAMLAIYRDLEFAAPGSAIRPARTREEMLLVIDTYQRLSGRVLILPHEFDALRQTQQQAAQQPEDDEEAHQDDGPEHDNTRSQDDGQNNDSESG